MTQTLQIFHQGARRNPKKKLDPEGCRFELKIQLRQREMGNETDMEREIKTGFTAGIDRNMEALPLRSVHFIQFEIRNIKSITCLIVHIAQIKLFEETLSS